MVRRAAWSVVRIVWAAVRLVLKEMGITTAVLILVTQVVWATVKTLRVRVKVCRVRAKIFSVRRAWTVPIIQRIIGVKHGFVLMVVDHHATDDAVGSGPNRLPCAGAGHWLLLWRPHHVAGCGGRGVKDIRRWGEPWDRREGASEETRGCGGALLGAQLLRFLEFLCLVRITS